MLLLLSLVQGLARAQSTAVTAFNVVTYGAKPGLWSCNGDSTTAFQNTFNAAAAVGGTVYVPYGFYCISSTVTEAGPTSGISSTAFFMNIQGDSSESTKIIWTGPAGSSMFRMLGWNNSSIRDISLNLGNTIANVVGWDLDLNPGQGSENLTWVNTFVDGMGIGGVGWRAGNVSSGGDFAFYNFVNARCISGSASTYCFLNESQNGLQWTWLNGGTDGVAYYYSNCRPGGGVNGGAGMYFYGVGNSLTSVADYSFCTNGNYLIEGGRYEVGALFLNAGDGGTFPVNVSLKDAYVGGYSATGNVLFNISGAINFDMEGNHVISTSSDYTTNMIEINAGLTGQISSINVRNNTITASEPFWAVNGPAGIVRVKLESNTRANESNGVTNLYQDVTTSYHAGETGSAPAPNLQNGTMQSWTLNTDATWGAPANPVQVGEMLTLLVTTSGAYTSTWNSSYYRNAPTWNATASGQKGTASFIWDGTHWQFIGGSTGFQ